jgi:protein-S-isoprenylcysteine O-methyltransferase Ste14
MNVMSRGRTIFWTVLRVAIVVLCVTWAVLQLHRWDHVLGSRIPAWLQIPGAVLLGAGAFAILLCGASLSTRGILEQRGDRLTPRSLETSGLFRYSRNPMSLGVVAFFAGLGLFRLSPFVLIFSVLLFLFLHLWVLYVEEPRLRNRFGQVYVEYERHTNRWLPTPQRRK